MSAARRSAPVELAPGRAAVEHAGSPGGRRGTHVAERLPPLEQLVADHRERVHLRAGVQGNVWLDSNQTAALSFPSRTFCSLAACCVSDMDAPRTCSHFAMQRTAAAASMRVLVQWLT